ncbi:AbrB/MazE/SpoVT family DNA-binding domain-containing protein [Priestia megaterium]|uniref:AbrB/MazE/SpoVT family DNA-binding domain-containing protein n=1 Tax=Priestia megaterium TaxID=1404 RepID=UPI00367322F2
MKSTDIVRKVDESGSIVIPVELRRVLNIKVKDSLEIFVDENQIIFKKYTAYRACAVTGEVTDQNREYAKGLILSPRGAEILKQEIESRFGVHA